MYPDELKYYEEHTWLRLEGDNKGRVGVTYYAQDLAKEIVYVELPQIDTEVTPTEPFGVMESRKATIDLYSPVSGVVREVNHLIESEPGLVNKDPYGQGWMILVELSNPAETGSLLSAEEYRDLVLTKK